MHKKILSLALAAMFVVAAFGGFLFAADESDATGPTTSGTYSVYAFNGTQWKSQVINTGVYDAAEALTSATQIWNSNTDSIVPKYIQGTYVTYNATTYGNINTLMGLSNGDVNYWHVYVSSNTTLRAATVSLGNYTCFSDYDSNYQASNIVLYYGTSAVSLSDVQTAWNNQINAETVVSISPITTVSSTDSGFAVRFALHIDTGATATVNGSYVDENNYAVNSDNLNNEVLFVTGYGSNAYLALKSAFSATNDVIGENAIPVNGYYYYSWMYTLFNVGTQPVGSDWAYWVIYDQHGELNDSDDHVADFVLGAYSPFATGIFGDSDFALMHELYSM